MYTTLQKLIDQFGEEELIQLTDRDGSAGAIVPAVLNQAMVYADSDIDSHLRGRYTVPLTPPVPTLMERIAGNRSRYYLYDDAKPEGVIREYDEDEKTLDKISRGLLKLDVTPATAVAGDVQVSAPDRVFTRDDLKDF